MGKKRIVCFRCDEGLWRKFGEKVRKYGGNRSRILRIMIREFCGEKVEEELI